MPAVPLYQTRAVQAFECLCERCEDTCCKGWGMQLAEQTVKKYEQDAPELLEAVTSGEADYIMKRDEQTDFCVKFSGGICSIHRDYGESFLGDACHFFPRVTRRLGDASVMTASLSCPEITRLALFSDKDLQLEQTETERLPFTIKDYLPEPLDADKALQTHQAFVDAAADESVSAERIMMRIRAAVPSLQMVDRESWPMAASFYVKHADTRLQPAQANPADPFNLLNALQGLVGAAKKTNRERLMQTIADMEQALDVTLNWETLGIQTNDNSLAAWQAIHARWQKEWAGHFQPVLKRWLQAQLSVALFPFAGFGETLEDRATILGVRLATVKLALMSACQIKGEVIDEAHSVRVIQSLSRFIDHLADPALSMQIYHETGWSGEARLRGLLHDV